MRLNYTGSAVNARGIRAASFATQRGLIRWTREGQIWSLCSFKRPSYIQEDFFWSSDWINFDNSWTAIVRGYTSCGLTKHKDKLMALTRVMSMVEENTGYLFIAGLCRDGFLSGLLQRAINIGTKSSLFPS